MRQAVLASNNQGKLLEFQQFFDGIGIEIIPQAEFSVPDVEETGLSFVENAILKARHASEYSGLPAIADDSGLEVDFLAGAPGIYSARFSGLAATDAANNHKLLTLLKDVPTEQRTARFQCLLVYLKHPRDPTPLICQGTWEGIIAEQMVGTQGFGYDPLFYLPDQRCTSAQLARSLKNQLSHRARAMRQLLEQLRRSAHTGH